MPRYWDNVGHDPYTDPQTGVLRNKLGIKDEATLERAEAVLAAAGSRKWQRAPESSRYDLDHLKSIHKQLFGHTYEWAGQIRSINISKGGSRFAEFRHIESAGNATLAKLADERQRLEPGSKEQFVKHAAHTLSEVNALHPFREGNGRTQREFIGQMAREAGHEIKWEGVSKERMAEASYHGMHGNIEPLERLIRERLVERQKEPGMTKVLESSLESDRGRLDRMSRSYAADHPKQASIENAREMLQKLEQGVREKKPIVELSAGASRFATVQTESLKLIQKSITSAEKSGIGVKHELREQWQSQHPVQEYRLQSGKDHGR